MEKNNNDMNMFLKRTSAFEIKRSLHRLYTKKIEEEHIQHYSTNKHKTCQFRDFNKQIQLINKSRVQLCLTRTTLQIHSKDRVLGWRIYISISSVIYGFGQQKMSLWSISRISDHRLSTSIALQNPLAVDTPKKVCSSVVASTLTVEDEYMRCWSLVTKQGQDKGGNIKFRSLVIKIKIFHDTSDIFLIWTVCHVSTDISHSITISLDIWVIYPTILSTPNIWVVDYNIQHDCWLYFLGGSWVMDWNLQSSIHFEPWDLPLANLRYPHDSEHPQISPDPDPENPTCAEQGFRGSFAETGTRSGDDHNPNTSQPGPLGRMGGMGCLLQRRSKTHPLVSNWCWDVQKKHMHNTSKLSSVSAKKADDSFLDQTIKQIGRWGTAVGSATGKHWNMSQTKRIGDISSVSRVHIYVCFLP